MGCHSGCRDSRDDTERDRTATVVRHRGGGKGGDLQLTESLGRRCFMGGWAILRSASGGKGGMGLSWWRSEKTCGRRISNLKFKISDCETRRRARHAESKRSACAGEA